MTNATETTKGEQLNNKSLDSDLAKLANKLSVYNTVDLLQSVAALQIMPENAERVIRLEALAHVISSLSYDSKKPLISKKKLLDVCNSKPIGKGFIAMQEDPFENAFTEAFTFYGGSYIVFPDSVAESTYILRQLASFLFHHNETIQDKDFLNYSTSLILASSIISNEIAKRAGLGRGEEPFTNQDNKVIIPNSKEFLVYKNSVLFSKKELQELLANYRLQLSALDSITSHLEEISLEDYESADKGKLFTHPIVRANDHFIVAIPCMLLTAVRNCIIQFAIDRNLKETLAAGFHDAVWKNVVQSLDYLKNELVRIKPPDNLSDILLLHQGFFSLDSDKLTYAMVVSDSFDEYDAKEPFGSQPIGNLPHRIYEHLKSVEKYIYSLHQPPNEVFYLVILQGVGRFSAFAFDELLEFKPNVLTMSAADLETIALVEGGKPLALFKYSKASWKARQHMQVMSWGDLYEYGFFKKRGYSYYLSDEKRPNLLSIDSDFGGYVRRKVIKKIDQHGAPSHKIGYITEVIALHGSKDIPIYVSRRSLGKQVAVLVGELPLPIWIVGPEYSTKEQHALHSIYAEFARSIAYWLWQFSPMLKPILELYASDNRILIELDIRYSEVWNLANKTESTSDGNPIDISIDQSTGKIRVVLHSQLINLLKGSDNIGEREIMKHVLSGLRDLLLRDKEIENLSSNQIDLILGKYANPATKKMMILLDTNRSPELDPRNLPAYRPVQKADESDLLDKLGDYLISKDYSLGQIPDDKRTQVLNEIVEFFQKEFESLISQLNPKGLLEWLVLNHESIIRQQSFGRLTTPTRLACFSSEREMVKKLSKEVPEISQAAMACRYIIEYVASKPPTGLRPISLSVYDRLMALSSLIIDFGFKSDLIYYQLADVKLAVLPSKRLGQKQETFLSARKSFLNKYVASGITSSIETFEDRFKVRQNIDKPEVIDELDPACKKEFGFSFTDLANFISAMLTLTDKLDPTIPKMNIKDLYSNLRKELKWSIGKIKQIIDRQSFRQRSDFFSPPEPFNSYDVWPWRFNRELSHVRRPLLQLNNNGTVEILWGPRFLYKTGLFLLELCMSGRLKAKTPEMRQLIGKLKHKEGESFNDQVADCIDKKEDLIVRKRVEKIGKVSLANLGDIDILVVDKKNKLVVVVECKNYEASRTPFEMGQELEKLFKGKGKKKSAIQKLQARQEFVQQNIDILCAWLGLNPKRKYKVKSLVVTDQEMFTPYLHKSPIEVISFRELKNILEKGGL